MGNMKNTLKIAIQSICILAVLFVVGLALASALGYVYIGIKQPAQVTQNRAVACSAQDIKEYNETVVTFVSTEDQLRDKAVKQQAKVNTLKKVSGFDQDPTCVFMEYSAAVANNNVQAAQSALSSLEGFSKDGLYPSNELFDVVSLDSMHDRIEALKNVDKENTETRGSG